MSVTFPDDSNLAIWRRNERTDPAMTKQFNRGGFRGTAVCPTDVVLRLTQQFGPCGCGWGVTVLDESIVEGAPIYSENGVLLAHEKVHRLRARFWYVHPETRQRCEFESYGMTEVVTRDKRGIVTDSEFGKKSLTDALTKAASWLGFSADIHLGKFDDVRYVQERVAEERAARAPTYPLSPLKPPPDKPSDAPPSDDPLRDKTDAAVRAFAAATSAARVEQLKKAASNGLATAIREAGREDLAQIMAGTIEAAEKRFPTPPANDEPPPFGDMPE